MTRYLLAGGGTAGHVNPLLAVADGLRDRDPGTYIRVLGTREGLEARLVPERGYELLTVDKLPFPRRPGRALLTFPGRFRAVVRDIRALIESHEIDVVVGFGGYVSAPAYLAARRAKVPIVVHEANAVPGLANRLGSWMTRHVGVAFAGTRLRGARVVGMPLRHELETLDRQATRPEALEAFGLDPHKPVLLVTGGSLGAQRLNETVWASAASILGTGWQLLHIVGERSELRSSELADYHIRAYVDEMHLALSAADLVLARAGSSTVSELSALGIPAVYVPLPIGNGEQRRNAAAVVEAGAAIIVDDADFTPAWVADDLVDLLADPAAIAVMTASAQSTGTRDGTARTIALIDHALGPEPLLAADDDAPDWGE